MVGKIWKCNSGILPDISLILFGVDGAELDWVVKRSWIGGILDLDFGVVEYSDSFLQESVEGIVNLKFFGTTSLLNGVSEVGVIIFNQF